MSAACAIFSKATHVVFFSFPLAGPRQKCVCGLCYLLQGYTCGPLQLSPSWPETKMCLRLVLSSPRLHMWSFSGWHCVTWAMANSKNMQAQITLPMGKSIHPRTEWNHLPTNQLIEHVLHPSNTPSIHLFTKCSIYLFIQQMLHLSIYSQAALFTKCSVYPFIH